MMLNYFKKKSNINYPEFWKKYISLFDTKRDDKTPISQAEFVVIDIESTGLNFKKDKILSIGGVKIKNNQIEVCNTFEIYLSQNEFNPNAALVHGIIKNTNVEKMPEQEGIEKLLEYVKNDIIVGHNIMFDISLLNETLKSNGCNKLLNKSIDTINLYKRLKGDDYKVESAVSLDLLCDEYKIIKSDRHNAAGDALITAILFLKLISSLKKRGITDLYSLLKTKGILF